jgi:hypothetical protein
MIFDAGRASNWVGSVRLDHIGFGVVCGEDGKRFKTRFILKIFYKLFLFLNWKDRVKLFA